HDNFPSTIYTLSLHDALPISTYEGEFVNIFHSLDHRTSIISPIQIQPLQKIKIITLLKVMMSNIFMRLVWLIYMEYWIKYLERLDRKSTRLNSSHLGISYAVF